MVLFTDGFWWAVKSLFEEALLLWCGRSTRGQPPRWNAFCFDWHFASFPLGSLAPAVLLRWSFVRYRSSSIFLVWSSVFSSVVCLLSFCRNFAYPIVPTVEVSFENLDIVFGVILLNWFRFSSWGLIRYWCDEKAMMKVITSLKRLKITKFFSASKRWRK